MTTLVLAKGKEDCMGYIPYSVKVKGTKLQCGITVESGSTKDVRKVATQSLAHKEFIDLNAQHSAQTFEQVKALRMPTASEAVNSLARTAFFQHHVIDGNSLDESIELANRAYEGDEMVMLEDTSSLVRGTLKELFSIRVKGRVC
jgi:hypothetical protein